MKHDIPLPFICFDASMFVLPTPAPKYHNLSQHPILPRIHLNVILSILIMNLLGQFGLFLYLVAHFTEFSFHLSKFSFGILHYFIF